MSQLFVDDVVSKEGTNSVGFSKGISVSVASTFSGDVSIGGTLTYEDVTNVDVVGLITARGGIKLGVAGIGGTFNANGDTTLAGVVTATSFVGALAGNVTGAASQITVADESTDTSCNVVFTTAATGDLPPKTGTNLTFNSSSGALTASSFVGDGSGLTNLVGTGVTNNVNTVNLNVISGVSTFNNNVTLAAGNLDVDAGQLLVGSNVLVGPAGVATFSGTGDVHLKDDVQLKVGDSSDLQIYHDGTNSYIHDDGTGSLRILVSQLLVRNTNDNENIIIGNQNGAVELYHDNTKKLETTGYGVTVSGGSCISGLTTAFGGLTVAGTMVESMSSTTTAYNTSGDLNITNGNFHFNSANLGGTGTTLNIMSTTGINTTVNVNEVLNVTAVTAVNASTAFVNKVTIDGKATGITTHWVGGSVPTDGGGSGVDTYSFNILKTGSETYIIVANQVKTS